MLGSIVSYTHQLALLIIMDFLSLLLFPAVSYSSIILACYQVILSCLCIILPYAILSRASAHSESLTLHQVLLASTYFELNSSFRSFVLLDISLAGSVQIFRLMLAPFIFQMMLLMYLGSISTDGVDYEDS